MNTFNMKQWLVENKIGPYGKMQEADPAAMGAPQAAADAKMEKEDDKNSDWLNMSDPVDEGYDEGGDWYDQFEDTLLNLPVDQPNRLKVLHGFNKHTENGNIEDYKQEYPTNAKEAAYEFAETVLGTKINRPVKEYSTGEDHIEYDDNETPMYGASDKPDATKYNIQRDNYGKVISATNQEGTTFKKGDTAKLQPQDNGKVIVINSFIEQQGKVKAIYSVRGTPYTYDIDGLDPVNPVKNEEIGIGYVTKTKLSDPKY